MRQTFRPFFGILKDINQFLGICRVYTKTIIHFIAGASGRYLSFLFATW